MMETGKRRQQLGRIDSLASLPEATQIYTRQEALNGSEQEIISHCGKREVVLEEGELVYQGVPQSNESICAAAPNLGTSDCLARWIHNMSIQRNTGARGKDWDDCSSIFSHLQPTHQVSPSPKQKEISAQLPE